MAGAMIIAIIVPGTTSISWKLTILLPINGLQGLAGVTPELVRAPKIQKIGFRSRKLDRAILRTLRTVGFGRARSVHGPGKMGKLQNCFFY
jgi:hypothetical protein